MDRILRVNLGTRKIESEPVPEAYRPLGGRALTSRILCDEVDPACDPFGPGNKLVWAPGLIGGTTTSSTGRISIGCKSPLTGGIKESNGGGEVATLLAQAGYRAVVVEGIAQPGQRYLLVIDVAGARLEPAPAELGSSSSAYADAGELFRMFGREAAISLCGPGGEQRMLVAGIGNTDREGRPTRICARGGVGAVMGAKGLKALVVLGNLRRPVPAADADLWRQNTRQYLKVLRENPSTGEQFPKFGTATVLELMNSLGGLPVRNFSKGSFAGADRISGVRMHELISERGGEGMTTHACMTGCAIRCSNVFADQAGREVVSSLEYETNALLGSNLEIDDFDTIARLAGICNDLLIDTIETGAALGVAMEAGLLAWGDGAAAERILDVDVRQGTPLGRLIGAGAAVAGRVLGVSRVPAVKGQSIGAYDPRAIKGNGITYSTNPMGGDHTAGNTSFWPIDHLDPSGKLNISRFMQVQQVVIDSLGLCTFARALFDVSRETFVDLFRARTGLSWTWDDMLLCSLDVIRREVQFNRGAGLGPATDRLPEWMCTEPLPPHNTVFDIPASDYADIWENVSLADLDFKSSGAPHSGRR